MRAMIELTSAWAWSMSAAVASCSLKSRSRLPSTSFASSSRTSDSGTARLAASSWACARPSIARTVESSRRASTWPSRTAIPSSTFTSTTLPVTLDETVARRRAVT